jgi:catechol 2,3-dioxygenase-like lactoylglutathione lyase family enzyme
MTNESMGSPEDDAHVEGLSAITLATHDMPRAVRFYEALGFRLLYGGANEAFTSFALGSSFLNLTSETHGPIQFWGRVIIYVSDVDAFYRKAQAHGIEPQFAPRDAPWNERYFHLTDPDGHELSFARPL